MDEYDHELSKIVAELNRAARDYAARYVVDLWHCEWTPYAQTMHALPGVRWLVMAHNVESLIWQRMAETERNLARRWYIRQQWNKYERFEQWAYTAATRTIAVSPDDARLMRVFQRVGRLHDQSRRPANIGFAGDVRARDNEKEGRAGHQHCEAMNTPGHKDFGLRISDCGFWRNRLRTKEPFKSAIRNPQSAIALMSAQHWELDRR